MRILNYLLLAIILMFASCSSVKNIPFSTSRYHVNPLSGYVQNADSSQMFTFCSEVINSNLLIIDSEESTQSYNGLRKYLNGICGQLEVNCDSILFYAPSYGTLIVEINETTPWKPRSQTTKMTESKPYTSWVRNDDIEDWVRKPSEIYSNVLLNKSKKYILVVDRFTYGNKDLALIHIIQSSTKQFCSIGLPQWTETWADVTDPTCLEPLANWIDEHRKIAIENYKLGLKR